MSQFLGQKLKQIREDQGISLEEIAEKTRIRLSYLKSIESGNTSALPSKVQLKGFLRLYANELGVELKELAVRKYYAPPEEQEETLVQEENDPGSILDSPPEGEQETLDIPKQDPDSLEDDSEKLIEALENTQPPSLETPEAKASSVIFSDIGARIKERRELLSLSLEDVESQIHVRQFYLKAIESGRISDIPSPAQAKGMLANYTEFLNLDSDQILLSFADALQKQREEKYASPERKQSAKAISRTSLRLKNFFSLDLLVITVLFITFAAFVIWGVNRIMTTNSPPTTNTEIPQVADVLLATGTTTPLVEESQESSTPEEGSLDGLDQEPTPLFTPLPQISPIQLVLIPNQRVWVQITSDDEVVYEGRLIPGNVYDFTGEEKVEVLTGNAAALQIYFNETGVGPSGLVGEVVNLIFSEDGLILPTPTNTPTITQTPEASSTPTITPSPTLELLETDDEAN